MNCVFKIAIFVILCDMSYLVSSEKKLICYYGTWATYRWGLGKFDVGNINVDLCTHLVYAFVGLNSDGTIAILDPYLDLPDYWGRDNFRKFTALKQQNPNLKTILAVGGWNEGSSKYSIMAANPVLRQTFVKSAVDLLLEYNFDGFDVDWEYPNRRDTVNGEADVDNYTELLKELKEALQSHGLSLSIAVSAVRQTASLSYDVTAISKYADHIGIMTYDLYGAWDLTTGHNSGLHRGMGDEHLPREDLFTVDMAVEYWLNSGCPPEKLIIGLPLYGRTFTLTNPDVNGVRAPSSGVGIAGEFTSTNGLIGYNELCSLMQKEVWDVRFDDLAKVPYAVQGRNWISFDNPESLAAKVAYAVSLNLGGAMVWSIETDDFYGICHDEDFPMLRAINRALGIHTDGSTTTTTAGPTTTTEGNTINSSTPVLTTTTAPSSITTEEVTSTTLTTELPPSPNTSEPTSTSTAPSTTQFTTTTTTTTTTPSTSVCKEEGMTSNPDDCYKFIYCVWNEKEELQTIEFSCPSNLMWDQRILACNYAYNVDCVN